MKAFLFKLYYLCRLAMQSRYLLFSEGFRESCLMPLRPALDSLHSLPPNIHLSLFRTRLLLAKDPRLLVGSTKMMRAHLSLEVNPYAIRSRYLVTGVAA